jgi:lincosamide nucleotidyltransferase A/C/D/E
MEFDLQPTLKGDLLELRPLRAEDYRDLYAAASDPLIWEQHPIRDRHKEEVFKEFFRDALESGGALIAVDSKDNRVIGSSRFHGYDKEKSEIEIGWTFLARSHWGGAYNKEMKQLMLRHAFRFVSRVIFLVSPENARSQRAVEKIGGVRMGTSSGESGRDNVVYQITASAFAQLESARAPKNDPEMTASDVVAFAQLLDQNRIDVWIDGGWGVDALLEEQTRSHSDLDIAIRHRDVDRLRALLEARGYKDVSRGDTRDCNFVLGDDLGHQIDVHTYEFDSAGNHVYGIAYPADSLTGTGLVNGYPVKCISPEWMVRFHTGYEADENDYRDVLALCQRFGIKTPSEYEKFAIKGGA